MKKILLSLFVVAMVGVGLFGATKAWFTDTEGVAGNTFTTGTIDIAVDTQNPWNRTLPYVLEDMKPSQMDYIDFEIQNVGSNPANVWKTLDNYVTSEFKSSEPELIVDSNLTINDIDNWINYDMRVELYNPQNALVWWETIYLDADNVKLGVLEGNRMYLGMIPAGWYMKVMQSYHMVNTAGNEYQGDKLTFDITLDAEQLGQSALVLENKEEVDGDLSHTVLTDSITGLLTYGVKDREFTYTLNVQGMADGPYTLISYNDPWIASNTLALANVTVVSGNGSTTGSIDLNQDLINKKTWLVPGTYTPGQQLPDMSFWDPSNMLFETGLMDYYDSDL